jgi:hypothetical protein
MEACIGRAKKQQEEDARRVVEEPPPRPPPPPRRSRAKLIAGASLAGGGALLMGAGAIFGWRADALAADVEDRCRLGCDWRDVEADDEAGRRAETLQWVFLASGAAVAITGGVLLYLGIREESPVSVAPAASGGGAVVTFGGRF